MKNVITLKDSKVILHNFEGIEKNISLRIYPTNQFTLSLSYKDSSCITVQYAIKDGCIENQALYNFFSKHWTRKTAYFCMFKWKFLLIRIQTYTINDTKIFERNIRKAPFGGLFLRNQANRHIKNIKNKERMIVMPQKILWFSRHEMSPEQKAALGNDIDIMQINQTINHASELSDEIKKADVIAIVAPIGL